MEQQGETRTGFPGLPVIDRILTPVVYEARGLHEMLQMYQTVLEYGDKEYSYAVLQMEQSAGKISAMVLELQRLFFK